MMHAELNDNLDSPSTRRSNVDQMKKSMAQAVQRLVMQPEFLHSIAFNAEGGAVTELETQIKVRTPNGTRYFVVQVKESYQCTS